MRSRESRASISWFVVSAASVLLMTAMPGLAQDDPEARISCKSGTDNSRFFRDIQVAARRLNEQACFALFGQGDADFLQHQNLFYKEFGELVRDTAITKFQGIPLQNASQPFDAFISKISERDFDEKQLPELRVDRESDVLKFHFDDFSNMGTLDRSHDESCRPPIGDECFVVLRDLASAVNDYKISYETITAKETTRILTDMSSRWDDYLENSRSQTLLDLTFTTLMENNHFETGYLVGPPKRQWSLFHPSLVYEHVGDDTAGDRDKLSVAIEWIGVNWWSDDSPLFGIPFGISITSVYADRTGVESTGHGVMLHFDNKYSLGWSDRSGDSGIYLSIDLLKFVEDKNKQFERFKAKLREF